MALGYTLRPEFAGVSPVNGADGPPSLLRWHSYHSECIGAWGGRGSQPHVVQNTRRQQSASCAGTPRRSPGGGCGLVYCHVY